MNVIRTTENWKGSIMLYTETWHGSILLYTAIFTWLTGTRYGGGGGTQEVVSHRLIHVHTHLAHRTVVTPSRKQKKTWML